MRRWQNIQNVALLRTLNSWQRLRWYLLLLLESRRLYRLEVFSAMCTSNLRGARVGNSLLVSVFGSGWRDAPRLVGHETGLQPLSTRDVVGLDRGRAPVRARGVIQVRHLVGQGINAFVFGQACSLIIPFKFVCEQHLELVLGWAGNGQLSRIERRPRCVPLVDWFYLFVTLRGTDTGKQFLSPDVTWRDGS